MWSQTILGYLLPTSTFCKGVGSIESLGGIRERELVSMIFWMFLGLSIDTKISRHKGVFITCVYIVSNEQEVD
jgi:hypothetical protein